MLVYASACATGARCQHNWFTQSIQTTGLWKVQIESLARWGGTVGRPPHNRDITAERDEYVECLPVHLPSLFPMGVEFLESLLLRGDLVLNFADAVPVAMCLGCRQRLV